MKNKLFIGIFAILLLLPIGFSALTDDLTAYWKFDKTSGTLAVDELKQYNGTLVNGVTWVAGKINNSVETTRTNSRYISTTLKQKNNFSVSFWFNYVTAPTGTETNILISQWTNTANSRWALQYDNTNKFSYNIGSTGGVILGNTFTVGTWYYLTLTYDGTTARVYLNGNSISNSTTTFTATETNGELFIGRYTSFEGHYGNAKYDELGYWERALTPNEINSLYNNGNGFSYPFSTTSTNFTITAKNEFNNESINNFSVSIDNINYTTTTGTITTHILQNNTNLFDLNFYGLENKLFSETFYNISVASNYQANISQKPLIKAFNIWNNATINNFVAEFDGINYTATNGEVYISDVGTKNLKISSTNYFDINQSQELSANQEYSFYLAQSIINFNAQNIISNQSVSNFNITISGIKKLNNETWNLASGTYNATFSKTGYFDKTQEITINALDEKTITILDVYNRTLEVRAKTKAGATINNFSIELTLLNTSFAGYSNTLSTTNGLITFAIIDGNYNLTIDAQGYEVKANSTTNTSFNFSLYTTNSILFNIYDEETNNLISQFVKLTLISDDFSYIFNTSNGTKYVDLLSPQTYTIFAESSGYPIRSYIFALNDRTFNELNIYMLNESNLDEIIATVYSEGYVSTIENAYIKVLKYFPEDNTYKLTETVKTNFEGVAILNLVKKTQYYKFIIEYPLGTVGFTSSPTFITSNTLNFELKPSIPSNIDLYNNIDYTLSFNNITNNFKLDYNSETILDYCLKIYEKVKGKEVLINETCQNAITGTILIGITPQNNSIFIAKAFVSFDNGVKYTFLNSLTQDFSALSDFDNSTALYIVFLLSIVFIMIGAVTSSNYVLLLAPLPFVFAIFLGLINFQIGIAFGLVFMFISVTTLLSVKRY